MKVKLPRDWRKTEKRYLTSAQIAWMCGFSASSVFRAIKEGKLKHIRTPGGHFRVERADALAWMKESGIVPAKAVLDLVASL